MGEGLKPSPKVALDAPEGVGPSGAYAVVGVRLGEDPFAFVFYRVCR